MTQSEAHLLERMPLANGLDICFYDRSKRLVGDRWQVQLLATVPIEIQADHFETCPEPQHAYQAFVAAHGNNIAFEYEKVSNFVAESEVAAVIAKMKEDFLKSSLAYLSRPDFAAKYILRKYLDWQEEEQRHRLHAAARLDLGADDS